MSNISRAIARASQYHRQGEHLLAEGLYRFALGQNAPDSAPAAFGLGVLAYETGRLALAIEMLGQAVAADERQPSWQARLGAALAKSQSLEPAERHLRRAIELDPHCGEAWINLAGVLHLQSRYDEALPIAQQAVRVAPQRAQAHHNLGTILLQLGRGEEAIASFDAALAIRPDYAEARWNRSATHLALGNYAAGWADYNWRERANQVRIRSFAEPRWDGSSLAGRSILVHGEQGIGDEILFASCVPDLVAQAEKCLVACHPRLGNLFARSFPGAVICPVEPDTSNDWRPDQPFDVHSPAGSVPAFVRPSAEAFPQRDRYLVADPAQVAAWRERFDALGEGLKIGISWRAGGVAAEQQRRTTQLTEWQALFQPDGVQWVNLQYGETAADLLEAKQRFGVTIHDWDDVDPLGDMDRVAAQIAALDLVICVGNATAHLAGALGVPTWVVLPRVPGWRWQLSAERLPWYSSPRLFRQSTAGDWTSVFGELANRLAQRCETWRQERRETAPCDRDRTSIDAPDPESSGDRIAAFVEEVRRHRKLREWDAAERRCREFLESHPEQAEAWFELGEACFALEEYVEAQSSFKRAIELDPSNATFHDRHADALYALDRIGPAIQALRTAVTLRLHFPEAYIKLGAWLESQANYEEALPACRKAVKQAPGNKLARFSLGTVLMHQGKAKDAVVELEEACQIDPEFALAHWNAGLAHLQLGHYREGWEGYEWRERAGRARLNRCAAPLWDGSSLAGKTIAVLAEQGAGDEIMFASCYDELLAQARRVVVCCGPRFARLFARSFPAAVIHTMGRTEPQPVRPPIAVDCYIHAGSLPRFFRTDAASFPTRPQYLKADPQQVARWRERYAQLGSGPKIGISWRAGEIGHEQRMRSIPLEAWGDLLKLPGVQFINLQHGDCQAELDGLRTQHGLHVHDWADANPLGDFDDYAAQVAALDGVVSVGNTVVHLAGALGVGCWVLLPRVANWRWLIDSESTPWYPSVCVARQASEGGWQPAFDRVMQELKSPDTTDSMSERASRQARTNVPSSLSKTPIDALMQEACRLQDAKQFKEAHRRFAEIVSRRPDHAEAIHRKGVIECLLKEHQAAAESLQRAVELDPQNAYCHYHLATAYYELDRLDDAIPALQRAARLAPNFPEAQLNLGGLLERRCRYEEALPVCQRAAELSPDSSKAHYNLGNVYFHQGRAAEAIEHYRRAYAIQPDYAKAHWNHAMAALQLCRFAEGWEKYEWRERSGEVVLDHCAKPLWDGSSLAGKNLLIMAEQGVGDEIMFATCYAEMIAQAKHCLIVCQPRLASLFKRSFPDATVHGFLRAAGNRWEPPVPIDCYIPAGSLPRYLRPTWESFPQPEYFLVPDRRKVEAWRQRYAELGPGLKVGISWRAGGVAKEQLRRSTELELWRGVFDVPGVEFVNLQYGDCTDDLRLAREQWGVTIHDFPEADPLGELDTVAAQIAALDLVISVGNTTVHMAGSLGVPTWTILPRVPGWRWMLEGDRTPWYSQVRLLRQTGNDWEPVFADLQQRLIEWSRRTDARREQPAARQPVRLRTDSPAKRSAPVARERDVAMEPGQQNVAAGLSQATVDWLAQGRVERQQGRLAEAAEAFRQAVATAPSDAGALVSLGGALLQLGRPAEALEPLQRAVAQKPDDAKLHVCWGVALHQVGRREEAIGVYRQALELDPSDAQGWNNLGCALQELDQDTAALDAFRQALDRSPNMAEAWQGRGTSLRKLGRVDDALESYTTAAQLRPSNPNLHINVGGTLQELGRPAEAMTAFREAVRLEPRLLNAHIGLGVALETLGQLDEALATYDCALEVLPQAAELHFNRANILRVLGRLEEAEAGYRAALAWRPAYDKAHTNLARTLRQQSRPGEAIGHDEQALRTTSDRAAGCANLAVSYLESGRLTEARRAFEQALSVRGDYAPARISLALLSLLQGEFATGWRDYEFRWQRLPAEEQPYRRLACPVWEGESLAGKTIFVQAEQGVGDDVMFASCTRDLIAQAGHCILECDQRLVEIYRRSFPQATIVGSKGIAALPAVVEGRAIDVQILSGSVPRYLRTRLAAFPQGPSYLVPDERRVARWQQRYASLGEGLNVGISWVGGGEPDERRQRSTTLDAWRELLTVPQANFVNLQYGTERHEAATFAAAHGLTIHDWADVDPLRDLEDQAAQIASLDLVISVSNATVHLAGALGVPTLNLLSPVPSWRWLLDRDRSVWYPSVRLLRCPQPGDWRVPLQQAAAYLRQRIAERRGGALRLDAAEKIAPRARAHQPIDRTSPEAKS